jgi:hypothetical protein
VVGGNFTTLGGQPYNYIARLSPGGALDTTFNPGADNFVLALAVQTDGKIIVGGDFGTLGGQTRNRIGRLSSATAALQNLTIHSSGTTVDWIRSGASPEVGRVTFEQSADGATYTSLGAGTRISGGWQATGFSLPRDQNLFVRARGYYATGQGAGSASIGESVRNFYLPKFSTVTTIVSDDPDPSRWGQEVTIVFTVTSPDGTPTGNVTVTDGVNTCVGTVAAGSCSTVLTRVGARTLTATYPGDANFNGSTSPGVAHTVNFFGVLLPLIVR